MSETLDAALNYAGRGWHVFAISTYKIPFRGTRGFKDGTTDRAAIEAMWKAHPHANVALSTGWHPTGPNLVVLDGDGTEGVAQLKALGALPPTLMARTPRGGVHLYYDLPPGERLRNYAAKRTQKGGPGLDIRADGGLAILPPSRNKKGDWHFENPLHPITVMPAHLIAACRALKPPRPEPAVQAKTLVLGPPPAWVGGGTDSVTGRLANVFTISELPGFLEALRQIPVTIGYDGFFDVGAACYDFDPGPLGLRIYKAWCWSCEQFRTEWFQKECEDKWGEYQKSTLPYEDRIHVGTVYKLAAEYRAKEARRVLDRPANTATAPVAEKPQPVDPHPPGTNGTATRDGHPIPAYFATQPAAIVFPDRSAKGAILPTCRNARVAIRGLGLACAHDTFHCRMSIGGQAIGQWAGELTDDAGQMLRVVIERTYLFDPGSTAVFDAAVQECLLEPHDPVCEYFASLTWDKVPRLDTWLATYMGAEQTPLNAEIGRLMLVAAVRRARKPGTKFDQIIVLESPEGYGKSSAIELLAGSDNFSDQSILTLDDKGQQEAVQGILLYEIADFAGMSRADVEKVKAFASRTRDRARPAYGRARVDRPRRCVFVATTNNETYLKSQTGNRRFWPVQVGRIDLGALGRDRDQLWAEAAWLEAGGVGLGLRADLWGTARDLQAARLDADPWDDILGRQAGKLTDDGREYRVLSCDIMDSALRLPAEKQNDVTAKRVAFTMRRLGWEGPKVIRVGEVLYKGYTRPKM